MGINFPRSQCVSRPIIACPIGSKNKNKMMSLVYEPFIAAISISVIWYHGVFLIFPRKTLSLIRQHFHAHIIPCDAPFVDVQLKAAAENSVALWEGKGTGKIESSRGGGLEHFHKVGRCVTLLLGRTLEPPPRHEQRILNVMCGNRCSSEK